MSERPLFTAIEYAARDIPEGWEVRICIERGSGWVVLFNPAGDVVDFDGDDLSVPNQVGQAVQYALGAGEAT
jgi:hypothetical protein